MTDDIASNISAENRRCDACSRLMRLQDLRKGRNARHLCWKCEEAEQNGHRFAT